MPSRDNTMFEPVAGEQLSNGAGPHLFAGNNGAGFARRGLVAFAVADSVPAGAVIDEVELTLHVSQEPSFDPSPRAYALHRAGRRWGEGASDSGTGGPSHGGGAGAAAVPGDATWTHAVLDTTAWSAAGGDFASVPSAVASVGGLGAHTWESTAKLVADVQAWVDDPSSDHGWILIGEESSAATARRFESREHDDPSVRPALTIVYTPRPPVATR